MENLELLKYPIGKFNVQKELSIQTSIERIQELPFKLQEAVADLSESELNTSYRPGGWSLRQVVHHLPDSHMNAYLRCKLAFTEDNPVILAYNEKTWAECEDAKNAGIEVSLSLLASLHLRWVNFLRSLDETEFNRTYFHPEHQRTFALTEVIQLYAWHGEHHLQQIVQTVKKEKF